MRRRRVRFPNLEAKQVAFVQTIRSRESLQEPGSVSAEAKGHAANVKLPSDDDGRATSQRGPFPSYSTELKVSIEALQAIRVQSKLLLNFMIFTRQTYHK